MATKKSDAQLAREVDEALGKSTGPRVLKIARGKTFAGRRSIAATIQYPGEPSMHVEFVGPTSGSGPVVMVTKGHQTLVTDPSRFGAFGQDWIRRFFA